MLTVCQSSNIWGRVLEDDISTFNTYAARIRHYEPRTSNNIHLFAYLHILQCCGRSHLLPNLVHFKPFKPDAKEVSFLLSPRLQGLSTRELIGNRPNPASLLNLLHSLSPNLVVLKLQCVVLDNRCLSALCLLTRVEEVLVEDAISEAATSLTLDFLFDMSARHTLRCLELIGSLKIVPSSKPRVNCDPITFSALKHIELDCDLAMASVTLLLRHITFPVLEKFRIGLCMFDRSDLQQHWYQFFNTIGNATRHFKELAFIRYLDDPLELHLSGPLKPGSFSLTSFTVEGPILSLSHRDMEAIIDAWPLLTVLCLPRHHGSLPKIDFSALIAIARGLPHLEHLELYINTSVLPNLQDIPLLSHGLPSFASDYSDMLIGNAKHFVRHYHGFAKPCGFWVGYKGVRVWVSIFDP